MQPLHPAIQTVWRIKMGLVTSVLVFGVLAYDVLNLFDRSRMLPFGLLPGLCLVLGLLSTFYLPRLRYRFWKFELTHEELYLERGILNRVRTIVPLRRIQHLDVSQDVIERNFELGKLIVHTAGTRSSDVILPGLQLQHAEQLRDAVKAYITEDAL